MIDAESLLSHETFIIMHPFSSAEVASPKFGGARLIFEQAEFLKQEGKEVTLISLENIGSITSLLLKYQSNIRQKTSLTSIPRSSEGRRWSLNLIGLLASDIVLKFDWMFKAKLKEKLKAISSSHPLIICHYPLYYRGIAQSLAAFDSKKMIYEHNVEWHFFESNAGKGPLSKLLIARLKRLELNSLAKADYVACVSKHDAMLLIAQNIDQAKITIWLPMTIGAKVVRNPNVGTIPRIAGGGYKVGFIGSNFGPNIVAVRNIIELAKKLRDSEITFVVIGSVRDAFQNADVPTNVHFTGYVDDMTSYLSDCDAFINPKTTSETGIEIKMFDYLKLDKPIIATTAGSHGFEHFDNVKISDIDGIERMLRSLVTIEA